MYSCVKSYGINGIDAYAVTVETTLSRSIPSFDVVGLPDAAVKESSSRVQSALVHAGYELPVAKITVNLAPASQKKSGPAFDLPIFLYEHSAQRPERQNLANIRQGGFEALGQRIASDPAWAPDFGPACIHPSAGATAMGVRAPLIAYNINLNSNDLALAKRIASKVRARDGGLPYCKALGIELAERGIVQVSMNMTDYRQTALWQAYEAVEREANAAGVEILESELIGLSPLEAIIDCARHYLRFTNIDLEKILEMRIFQPENKQ